MTGAPLAKHDDITTAELIDVQAKQVIGLPDWADTDRFDMDGKPDGEGAPSGKQWKTMIQKLLADRFQLKFHKDKKELSVYVLSVTKTGEKMTKNDSDPNGLPGLGFRGLGKLVVRNATIPDFAGLMQTVVLDRPVVDQTGLAGKYNFELQFERGDDPSDYASVLAAVKQLGLKLEKYKGPVEFLVIDHLDKLLEN